MNINSQKSILEKIEEFISRNPGVFTHEVFSAKGVIFKQKYNPDVERYQVINDIYLAYFSLLGEDEDFVFNRENDKILLKGLYKQREYERQSIKGNWNQGTGIIDDFENRDYKSEKDSFPSLTSGNNFSSQIQQVETELFDDFIPMDLEKDGIVPDREFFERIIDHCFELPHFEQEAYKLRFTFPSLLKELNDLNLKLNPQKEGSFSDNYNNHNDIPALKMTEQEIKKIKSRINEIYDQLYNFKNSALADSYDPEGILLLQKRAYIRIFNNWNDTIKPNLVKYLLANQA